MADFALIDTTTNTILEFHGFVDRPPDLPHKNLKWLPVVVTLPPMEDDQVREGPVVTVEADRVTRVWTVRDKTAQEIDDEKEGYLNDLEQLGFEIDFDHENRIRVLEGRAQVTVAQFRAALKARL